MIRAGLIIVLLIGICAPCLARQGSSDPAVVRAQLRQILSAPEYNRVYVREETTPLFRRIQEWLGKISLWLRKVMGMHIKGGDRASIWLAVVVMAGFFALAAFLLRRVLAGGGSIHTESTKSDASIYQLPATGPLLDRARLLSDGGDYREAFRCAYLAIIASLDERSIIRFERSRTNWEYLRELNRKGLDRQSADLRPLTSDFDRKIYGGESCDVDDYRRALDAYERAASEVPA